MPPIAVALMIWIIGGCISAYLHRDAWGLGWIGGFILGTLGVIRFMVIEWQERRRQPHHSGES